MSAYASPSVWSPCPPHGTQSGSLDSLSSLASPPERYFLWPSKAAAASATPSLPTPVCLLPPSSTRLYAPWGHHLFCSFLHPLYLYGTWHIIGTQQTFWNGWLICPTAQDSYPIFYVLFKRRSSHWMTYNPREERVTHLVDIKAVLYYFETWGTQRTGHVGEAQSYKWKVLEAAGVQGFLCSLGRHTC